MAMKRILFYGIVSVTALSLACGGGDGGGGGGPSDTAASLTSKGWTEFDGGDYHDAITKFNEALALDAGYAEAHCGLGWAYARLDSLNKALNALSQCISHGMTDADPYAGKAPVYRDLKPPQFTQAISSAATALSKDSDYVFDHYQSFDWRDLHLIKAQSYYGLAQYTNAKGEVDALGGISLDPESDTFEEDLAAEIERLEGLYGG
jgi:tetratricopeptide (TPR) repeat protein